jgi:hypothetical protein
MVSSLCPSVHHPICPVSLLTSYSLLNETTRAAIPVRTLTRHGGAAMCVVFNDPNSIITVDDAQGPNDGSREVGQDVFERMFVLRCDGQFKNSYEVVYMGERRDNSLVAQTMQEFRNAGAGAGEKVSGVVGRMLEACRFRA